MTEAGLADAATAERSEVALVIAGALYRVYGLTQIVATVWSAWHWYPHPEDTLVLSAVLAAEGTAVVVICLRRRRLVPGLLAVDVGVLMVALAAAGRYTDVHASSALVDYVYPYSIAASVAIGFAFRGYLAVLAAAIGLAGAYVLGEVLDGHESSAAVAPNLLGYLANTAAAFVFAHYLRRLAGQVDTSRAEALERADALARERERARHARLLHDGVLQTLEALGRGDHLPDPEIRAQVAADAAWLRGFIQGAESDHGGDLLAGLQRLVREKAAGGLHVDLNAAQLNDASQGIDLAQAVIDALVGATREALTNVIKHSGVRHAVVRAALTAAEVVVSVADQGCGFDATRTSRQAGLTGSISQRMDEVGGRALIESLPGAGTLIELTVPRQGRR